MPKKANKPVKVSAENKDEKAIQDKKNEINETTTKLNGYKSILGGLL